MRNGRWQGASPRPLALEQGPVDVTFEQGLVRQRTRSQVYDASHQPRDITDGAPATIEGYRFSVSGNKGFAVVLLWRGDDGSEQLGSLNMPSYPAHEWKQTQAWRTPGAQPVQISLRLPRRSSQTWSLRALLPVAAVTLRAEDGEVTLQPGGSVALRGGTLRLVDVRLWMGYRVDRQPMLVPLLVCAFLGIGALGWHVMRGAFSAPVAEWAVQRRSPDGSHAAHV